jgi:hypothetical protein|tara:strand:+ start:2064 stop:2375 length:312 start_codon:yes stop_codon:yes gene_type:complete
MAVRQKQLVLDTAYKHFKEFELPLDIDYKSYMNIVGPKDAIHAISVKRSFKAWKFLTHALKLKHPDLGKKPEPAPAPKPAPEPKKDPLEALSKAAPAEEKSED